ncbi:LacI family DNA-binding transcriptional regulator [Edaphobacter sp. 12200R-103]|uniref:LacI family DNA-binding transcriptional regulator n=1 Tax=Edaphobacter sp. 12200R-103 TaxID=2703788 RepID=UPI00138CB9DC|nr:LacI family DNA-binding transcriptional regulator [Edaphobacter sp. 12200R-103]QHS51616.1 LacI family transcriptional regulator [Edaphobacter sp. 12200R-103]
MTESFPKKRATLQDVARAAGVGPMTVSRTINGHPYVAEETARKVQEAIRLLDYRPNHAARMLTGKLSRSIGLIVPDISDTFFSVVSHAVQEAARENGYLVWLAASDEDPSIEEAQVEMMMHHPVDGILLVPCDSRAKYLKSIATGVTPVVTIDRPMEVATTDSVGVENRAGAVMAVEHLLAHGYRRIACVSANSHLLTIKERITGYRDAMRRADLPVLKEANLPTRAAARQILTEMFSGPDHPDAIFAANNASTIWIIESLKEMGIELGREVALVGFDDVDFFTLITPSVTAVRQPSAELGKVSAKLLLQRINGEFQTSSVRTVLPVTLTIRESCGCRSGDSPNPGRESGAAD